MWIDTGLDTKANMKSFSGIVLQWKVGIRCSGLSRGSDKVDDTHCRAEENMQRMERLAEHGKRRMDAGPVRIPKAKSFKQGGS